MHGLVLSVSVAILMLQGSAAPAQEPPGPRAGEVYELRLLRESSQTATDGSSGSTHDADVLVERVIAVREGGVELEFDLPEETTAEDRARTWQFPVRVFKPAQGPLQLLNGPELEARVDRWLAAGGMTRESCGHWIFTWNAFRIECDPQSVMQLLAAVDLASHDLRDGTAFQEAGGLGGTLRRESADRNGAVYVVEMAVDPQAVREERARADAAMREIMGDSPELGQAMHARTPDQISGTIKIRFETDAAGHVRRRTTVTELAMDGPGGRHETETVTETVERRLAASPDRARSQAGLR